MRLQFEEKNTGGKFTIILREPTLRGIGILNDRKETINTIVCNIHQDQTVVIDGVLILFRLNLFCLWSQTSILNLNIPKT